MVGRWMAAVSELPACAAGRVALVAAQAVCKDLPAELERGAWKGRGPVRASGEGGGSARGVGACELCEFMNVL